MAPRFLLLIATICCTGNGLAQQTCPSPLERTAYLMGTTLRLAVCAQTREAAIGATEQAFAEVRRLESVLSSWTPDSEVGRLNRLTSDTLATVSPELYDLLAKADHWVHETGGTFDPSVGALVDVWGFRTTPSVPTDAQLAHALQQSGWSQFSLRGSGRVRRGPAGWWIDTGGFGKGAAIANVVDVLRRNDVRTATIDFGGQLMIVGRTERVAVADPRDRGRAVTSLSVHDASIATSSQSERYIEANGHRYGHILDPRTGRPVAAWGSVTVVARDALAADALSTALFVMGPRAALAWAANHPAVGVLVLESGHAGAHATWSRALDQSIVQEI